jgi:hypothetical protein
MRLRECPSSIAWPHPSSDIGCHRLESSLRPPMKRCKRHQSHQCCGTRVQHLDLHLQYPASIRLDQVSVASPMCATRGIFLLFDIFQPDYELTLVPHKSSSALSRSQSGTLEPCVLRYCDEPTVQPWLQSPDIPPW